MIRIRSAIDRGSFHHGWLETWHTFSFGEYYDPQFTGFRSLRVMNEDRIAPGQGFGTHPHRDMEIVTYVLSGALEHRDSMGNGELLRPGEFQRMTAGTGITHSEFNPSPSEPVHLYQIWLLPERKGLTPSYQQTAFPRTERQDQWKLVASRNAAEGSLTIHADARIFLASLRNQASVHYEIAPSRHVWVQMLRGGGQLNGLRLNTGDGAAVSDENAIQIQAFGESELLLFDLA